MPDSAGALVHPATSVKAMIDETTDVNGVRPTDSSGRSGTLRRYTLSRCSASMCSAEPSVDVGSREVPPSFLDSSRMSVSRLFAAAAMLAACGTAQSLRAQENYEIQVYGSETVPRGVTMFELHSNYTLMGSKLSPSSALSP